MVSICFLEKSMVITIKIRWSIYMAMLVYQSVPPTEDFLVGCPAGT